VHHEERALSWSECKVSEMALAVSVAVLALAATASASDQENPGRLLGKAGLSLAEIPVGREGAEGGEFANPEAGRRLTGYEVHQPKREDLELSRLQDQTKNTFAELWLHLSEPQRLKILSERPGGAARAVLAQIGNDISEGIESVEGKLGLRATWSFLNRLDARGSAGEAWREHWTILRRVRGLVDAHYEFLVRYMSEPARVPEGALEDYSRSLVEPGGSADISLVSSMMALHNISVPGLGLVRYNGEMVDEIRREDIFHRLSFVLKGKVHLNATYPQVVTSAQSISPCRTAITCARWARVRTSSSTTCTTSSP